MRNPCTDARTLTTWVSLVTRVARIDSRRRSLAMLTSRRSTDFKIPRASGGDAKGTPRELSISRRADRCSGVVNETELVALRVSHDDHDTFVVLMPFPGTVPAECADSFDGLVDVVDGNVKMHTVLATLWFGHGLEDEPRLRVPAMPEVDPSVLSWTWFTLEQGAPELRYALGVEAVEGDTGPNSGHLPTLRPTFETRQHS